MTQVYPWLILAFLIFMVVASPIIIVRSLWKDKEMFYKSWGNMTSFEKRSLQIGLMLYIFIPLLKDHPLKDSYIAKVTVDIFTALAGAFLVLGVLAFLKYIHELSESSKD